MRRTFQNDLTGGSQNSGGYFAWKELSYEMSYDPGYASYLWRHIFDICKQMNNVKMCASKKRIDVFEHLARYMKIN